MCGIFGYFDAIFRSVNVERLQAMGAAIDYRGPDGAGCFHDEGLAVGLGNQRLAILDVAHGQQPFVSDDEQVVVVQNGEIFNHVELAQSLAQDGFACRTHCDTEVILRLYEREGIGGLSKLNGMFAIAIYDKRLDALYLARDRVGEKPLFVLHEDGRTLFASEIKSILQVCGKRAVNFEALNQFFAFNFVPPPLTMFSGVKHVMPGCYLKVTRDGVSEHRWWDLSQVALLDLDETDWIERFNQTLDDAVRLRLRADVPFGAYLSGGVDSSSVVGLMTRHLKNPVKTFAIGFEDEKYDESPFAQMAADRFGAEHTLRKVQANLMDKWPMTTYHCDQPHGDVSFLPTYEVAKLASEHVKMVLTGDGGDELFAGYDKYRHFFEGDVDVLSDGDFQRKYLHQISLFGLEGREKLFSSVVKEQVGDLDVFDVVAPLYEKAAHMDRLNQALYLDMQLLLPGNNLVKPDRMSMAVSIENRAPFLDYRMMELAFAMPGEFKLRDGETKYLFKKAVTPLIGKELAYRKKQMFTVPIGEWFKTDLAELCQELLFAEKTVERGLFDYAFVREMYDAHCEGRGNYTREIRALMAVEVWFREFGGFL